MVHLLLCVIYLAFIGLGLPDPLLGSSWPVMHTEMGVPVSYAGILFLITAAGTVLSSLLCDRLIRRYRVGMITFASTLIVALSILGFALHPPFWGLCLICIPYGLGAGCIDAALNNYVALHYSGRHMSWLHSMWGLGTIFGPYLVGYLLAGGAEWMAGYRVVGWILIALSVILFTALPLWEKCFPGNGKAEEETTEKAAAPSDTVLPVKELLRVRGVKEVMLAFFCYCAFEQCGILWSATYLTEELAFSEDAASRAGGLFLVGITVGRILNGFFVNRIGDERSIYLGAGILLAGILWLWVSSSSVITVAGLFLFGLGCAPIYPAIIHSTPKNFGADKSQALIGLQMASAYIGTCVAPPVFGMLARRISFGLFPVYLLVLAFLMVFFLRKVFRPSVPQIRGINAPF